MYSLRYPSDYSRAGQSILPLSLSAPPGTITIQETSAVGTVVGVGNKVIVTDHCHLVGSSSLF